MSAEPEKAPEGEGTENAEEGQSKPKSKLPLIIGGVVGLLVLGGAGAYFAGLFGGEDPEKAKAEEAAKLAAIPPTFVDFPEILVNLNEPGRKGKFLKLNVKFEIADPTGVAVIEGLKPRIIDQFQMYLRELRLEDLQGSEGLHRLRDELLKRVNLEVKPLVVKDVLFIDVLIQ